MSGNSGPGTILCSGESKICRAVGALTSADEAVVVVVDVVFVVAAAPFGAAEDFSKKGPHNESAVSFEVRSLPNNV